MQKQVTPFGQPAEALIYPLLLVLVLWTIHLFQVTDVIHLVQWGVRPKDFSSWKGIFTMPLIHSPNDFKHIISNTVPIYVLSAALIYFYRSIALWVAIMIWVVPGVGVWLFAPDTHSFHIGISGQIYGLAAFLFFSGYQRSYLPLQALSLFVAFVYGGIIWGIFPVKANISWEGHLSGLVVGTVLAIVFAKLGPQAPKFQYEIEKEMGIEVPDLEGQYWERIRAIEAANAQLEVEKQKAETQPEIRIQYHFKPTNPPDENDEQS